jgi:hypothetical protein
MFYYRNITTQKETNADRNLQLDYLSEQNFTQQQYQQYFYCILA